MLYIQPSKKTIESEGERERKRESERAPRVQKAQSAHKDRQWRDGEKPAEERVCLAFTSLEAKNKTL